MATVNELVAVAEENIDYDIEGSVAKCKLLIAALRKIVLRRPKFVTVGGNQVTFETMMDMLRDAESWLAANAGPTTGSTSSGQSQYYDMRDIRR